MTPKSLEMRRGLPKLAATILIAVVFALGMVGPSCAGPMSGAWTAYSRGDYGAAAKRLGPLAAAGYARAQALLAFLYEYGRGVPQDYVSAAAWYTRAAEQGEPAAQYSLGLMYDKGRGVPQDAVLAHKWLNLAAARAGRRERDAYTRLRDAVATKMSSAQIALAQQLAGEWTPKRER
jgi:TPR repeat protein